MNTSTELLYGMHLESMLHGVLIRSFHNGPPVVTVSYVWLFRPSCRDNPLILLCNSLIFWIFFSNILFSALLISLGSAFFHDSALIYTNLCLSNSSVIPYSVVTASSKFISPKITCHIICV